MDYVNRIKLRGVIGHINVENINGTNFCRVSVMTCTSKRAKDDVIIVDTQWHNVTAWENGKGVKDLETVKTTYKKGDIVELTGHLVYRKYVDSEGVDRTGTEIMADKLNFTQSDWA